MENGGVMLEATRDNYKENRANLKKTRAVIFAVFKTVLNGISRMRITGLVKQINPMLERKLRNIVATVLKNILIRKPVVIVDGVKYYLSDTRFESLITLFAEYEKYVWKYFKPAKGDVFIDIGAHVGKYTLQVARIVENDGLVIAIEPHPKNYQALLKGIQLNGFKNIVALNVAAWNRDCKIKLFIHDAAVHHSTKIDLGLGQIEVQARTIDHIIDELGVKRINWVKIDVEGAEIEVLHGLKKTLVNCNPRVIIEVQRENLKDVLRFMEGYKYIVKPIAMEKDPRAGWGYLYCEPVALKSQCLS